MIEVAPQTVKNRDLAMDSAVYMVEFAPRTDEKMSYNEAVLYCQFLDIDGKRGWRIPTWLEYFVHYTPNLAGCWHTDRDGAINNVGYWPVVPVRDI